MSKKDIVIKYFDEKTVDLIRDKKDITIYVWKDAIHPWHDVDEFIKFIELNNIKVIYFEKKDNYLNKPEWIIADEDNSYWTGSYAEHPFGGRARLFLHHKCYAKKYLSKKVAERAAEKMKDNGVFGKKGTYLILPA